MMTYPWGRAGAPEAGAASRALTPGGVVQFTRTVAQVGPITSTLSAQVFLRSK